MPWYIYLAIRQLKPSGKRFGSVFFLLAVLGVALGVAVLLIVQSVMGGFGEVHRERIIDTSGHVDINAGGYPFEDGLALRRKLSEMEETDRVTAYAQGFVMARKNSVPTFPAIYGIDSSQLPVFNLDQYMVSGSFEDLYDDTVMISSRLSQQLGAYVGSEIEVFSPTMIEKMGSDGINLPVVFTVAGIYNIDWNQDFLPGIICTLRTMQDMYDLGDRLHGIAIRLQPGMDEVEFVQELQEELPSFLQAITWRERWASFLWVLDLEKTMMLFLNLFIVAVAVFAIAIAQLLTVVRKTREIGLLNVLGGSRRSVLGIYCFQGFFIGLVGVVAGIVIAVFFLSVRTPIINFLSGITGSRDTLVQYYYFANLPVKYEWQTFLVVGVLAIILSTMASLLPAMRAARLKAAETLRVEQ